MATKTNLLSHTSQRSAQPCCALTRTGRTVCSVTRRFVQVNDMYLWNAWWFIFITMTTVGYGDIVPSTHMGRLTSVVACFVGIVIQSLITAALANLMRFTPHVSRAPAPQCLTLPQPQSSHAARPVRGTVRTRRVRSVPLTPDPPRSTLGCT
jgi:hypothetical protein